MNEALGSWGLRFLALLFAVLSWVFVTVEQSEPENLKVLNTSIRYDSPPGFILLDPPENVRLTVRGRASSLRSLNPFQVDVFVEIPSAEKGTHQVTLSEENVFVPEDLAIVSIEPKILHLVLDREVTRMLPVEPRLTGEPAAGAVVQQPTVVPSRVPVRGPESRISEIPFLTTTPINLDTHALDFEERAGVVSDDPNIQVLQPVVTVRIPMLIPTAGEGASR